MQRAQLGPVAIDIESGHDPHDESEEVHDGRDVVEHATQFRFAPVEHVESGGNRGGALSFEAAFGAGRPRSTDALGQLLEVVGADLLREERAIRSHDARDRRPRRADRVAAEHEVEALVTERKLGSAMCDHVTAERP